MSELLLGDEAIGLAAIHAGIRGVFSYPGTPATEILEFVEARTAGNNDVSAKWSANEKVAYEEALGMSYTGYRSLVAMKHVGLNVAADAFINSAFTGAHGGLVLVVADDPGMHSSQNEQDTRFYGDFASIPMFEPATQQEAYEMTREAFDISERFHLPILIRIVTRLAHSRAPIHVTDPVTLQPRVKDTPERGNWLLLPVNARRRYRELIEFQSTLQDYSENSRFNMLDLRGSLGIIATGIAYNHVREVIGDDSTYSVFKVGTYPAPGEMVRKLVDHCEDIVVIEEGYPYLETQLTGMLGIPGKSIRGKRTGALPRDGELTADTVRAAIGMPAVETLAPITDLPNRPPRLCDGCPHTDTFKAMMEAVGPFDSPLLFSDIGCYTLGALPPHNAIHTCVDMGASVSMGVGAAKAGAHPIVCTIGDSTFTHSGMTGLIGATHEDANMTLVILDNATTGMTGGQESFATGDNLLDLLKGLGVKEEHLVRIVPLKKNHEKNTDIFKKEIAHQGLSVIVAWRACIQIKPTKVRETAPKKATKS